jgi:metal-responsive CopG/Arc/MetJ family transcriptional regulator
LERKIPVGVSLPKRTLDAIDKDRGQVPRSTWVVDALEARLKHITKRDKN